MRWPPGFSADLTLGLNVVGNMQKAGDAYSIQNTDHVVSLSDIVQQHVLQ